MECWSGDKNCRLQHEGRLTFNPSHVGEWSLVTARRILGHPVELPFDRGGPAEIIKLIPLFNDCFIVLNTTFDMKHLYGVFPTQRVNRGRSFEASEIQGSSLRT